MNTNTKIVIVAILCLGIVISCKNKVAESENSTDSVTMPSTDSTNVIASSSNLEPSKNNRKCIRTADIKFKVKNVPQSTYAIENAANRFGGFVTNSNLQSTISNRTVTKISQDSTLETTKYTVENNITLRVPNTRLDTVIKIISRQIDFLEYRIIKADEVTFRMLSNQLAQNRMSSHEKRMEKAIDTKGKKINDIIAAEDNLNIKKEQNDNSKLNNLSLQDQVNFSTITLQIYQSETIKQELIANEKTYRQNFGSQLIDGLSSGWFVLEDIITFLVKTWSLLLIGILGFLGYKKYFKNSK